MGLLRVTVDAAAAVPGSLVPVEIADVGSGSGPSLVLAAGRRPRQEIDLPDGRYVVRAVAPSGERWSEVIDLAGPVSVSLLAGIRAEPEPPGSGRGFTLVPRRRPRELVDWIAGTTAALAAGAVLSFLVTGGVPLAIVTLRTGRPTRLDQRRPGRRPVYCGLATPDGLPEFTAVPPGASAEVTADSDAVSSTGEVRIRLRDQAAQTLLDHLAGGRLLSAALVAGPVIERAATQRGRKADPTLACVAGYYALTSEAPGLGLDWSTVTARDFPWLTDVLVIHAAMLLRELGAEAVPQARRLLLDATESELGPPRFTQGLRLLHDTLTRILRHEATLAMIDPVAVEARARVERYVRAADWSRYFTTFTGSTPELPQVPGTDGRTEARAPQGLGSAGRLPVTLAEHEDDTRAVPDGAGHGLTVRHAASGPLVHAAADGETTHARRVTAGDVNFDLDEVSDRSDGTPVWLLTARSGRAEEGWAVVFVRDGTAVDAPYLQYVIPLTRSPLTLDAVGSLLMGPSTEGLDWYAAEQAVTDVHAVADRPALERSLASTASPTVARALGLALERMP
ncbi:hypothetical protein [Streptacidiphilus sp. EB129]|uniref:hypothetical protein n=1 Tax=Streptacidiphilus sp. EB129 TaxID=3156262 RepID=UPI003510D73C